MRGAVFNIIPPPCRLTDLASLRKKQAGCELSASTSLEVPNSAPNELPLRERPEAAIAESDRVKKRCATRGDFEANMSDAAIIGAGLAGLHCALTLERAGLEVSLLEASDAPGGRVRTDLVEGFHLDRGFQVLLTSYPEAQRALDYEALNLCSFQPGALVWHDSRFHRFTDPFREPMAALSFLLDGVVPFSDKLRVGRLRSRVREDEENSPFTHPDQPTREFLHEFGFSPKIIERFLAPFFGGVFLEKELVTSSRFFEFLFRMFASGAAAVPAEGMEMIPRQLAERLKPGTLMTNARVKQIAKSGAQFSIEMDSKDSIAADTIVLAVAEHERQPLFNGLVRRGKSSSPKPRKWNATTTFYYAAERAPVEQAMLILNGEGRTAGPINNLAVMSKVSRQYAPAGAELMAVSVVGEAPQSDLGMTDLEASIRDHAKVWFGNAVRGWQVLGAYPIRYALPLALTTQSHSEPVRAAEDDIYICGDAEETPSIQGALFSGRRVATSILTRAGIRIPSTHVGNRE